MTWDTKNTHNKPGNEAHYWILKVETDIGHFGYFPEFYQ